MVATCLPGMRSRVRRSDHPGHWDAYLIRLTSVQTRVPPDRDLKPVRFQQSLNRISTSTSRLQLHKRITNYSNISQAAQKIGLEANIYLTFLDANSGQTWSDQQVMLGVSSSLKCAFSHRCADVSPWSAPAI
jgi:hypothetical protein